jgi:hypothetical protein
VFFVVKKQILPQRKQRKSHREDKEVSTKTLGAKNPEIKFLTLIYDSLFETH